MADNYAYYFEIDKDYFPVVSEDLMDKHDDIWTNFYPHKTFIGLLENTIDILTRKKKLSLWVEGPYGTGKSYAVFTLKKMLEASDGEIKEYFSKYKSAGLTDDLCNRFLNARDGNIVVAS